MLWIVFVTLYLGTMNEKEAVQRIHILRNNVELYRKKLEKLQADPGHDKRYVEMYQYFIKKAEMEISDLYTCLKG